MLLLSVSNHISKYSTQQGVMSDSNVSIEKSDYQSNYQKSHNTSDSSSKLLKLNAESDRDQTWYVNLSGFTRDCLNYYLSLSSLYFNNGLGSSG